MGCACIYHCGSSGSSALVWPPCYSVQAAVAEYSAQVQQWAARVQQLEAAGASPAVTAAAPTAADAVARLAALQQQASEAEVQVTSLQAENRALREQVGSGVVGACREEPPEAAAISQQACRCCPQLL